MAHILPENVMLLYRQTAEKTLQIGIQDCSSGEIMDCRSYRIDGVLKSNHVDFYARAYRSELIEHGVI